MNQNEPQPQPQAQHGPVPIYIQRSCATFAPQIHEHYQDLLIYDPATLTGDRIVIYYEISRPAGGGSRWRTVANRCPFRIWIWRTGTPSWRRKIGQAATFEEAMAIAKRRQLQAEAGRLRPIPTIRRIH